MTAHSIKRGSRASDERLLQWLAARAAGMSQATIAQAYDANRGQVSRDVAQVIDADLRESGESAEEVMSGYPWHKFPVAAAEAAQ